MENNYRIYSTRDKKHWGPIYWNFLYLTVMGFPVSLSHEQKHNFTTLIQNFHIFLPCAECRHHYKREVQNLKLNITNKNEAFSVVLHLHNKVRERQKKRKMEIDDIINYHHSMTSWSINKYLILLVLIILLILAKDTIYTWMRRHGIVFSSNWFSVVS